ncbi:MULTISPECIES: RrF2 family transcriptional regulator [Rhizobium/Agrobacterium group]|jgi:Rrf2 family protein|uniref:Rrf2 family transcriptional regulator n=2 Tax=Rhizobium/Agrobacterium group TaxID=227290 RepID=A0A1B9V5J0_AGRTU|nr:MULTISPECIES: Rrf2 family transcriptional regulator [Rhizobium/Agrobacterium group]AHK00351.1 Rrf2 family transcriptional regulator of 4-carboxymuconolactone decarboxylase [Agrobacterium tumefaciens LBA4213 (Ach5)]AKC06203.1 Rrf2 family transcriptional regulator [Agrobacterium tumefaciens]MDP9559795.1 Rrf2 family protein [Rhizobium nepotum]QDG92188.1 Rrf2 family transcriptional regulator [Rhizobium sp. NIBRBAC000502774]HCV73474.1 Rrf2 family transcriptional regulator [Agrobacterium sp.]
MKLGDGVEQAIHSVGMLAGLSEGGVLSAAALAEFHGVSTSYLLKHLQLLSGAGIVSTVPGPKGGYRLARTTDKITLLDIVLAVEGPQPAFRCAEIRQRGPNPLPGRYFTKPCGINAAMLKAEKAYRAELAKTSIADILGDLAATDDGGIAARGCAFLELNERRTATR